MQQPPSKPQPDDDDSVSHVDLTQSAEEVLEYWTKERMAAAKPREIRLPEPGSRPADQD
ncbi:MULTISPECIES: hypothetical protein [Micrococcaceae]|uniref:DUF3306 domain-containing protein n=1 Tax=Arthrobacter sedimenti TaxID=2694931 RepID=A0ABV8WHY0_9MICC|nr:hypothetical protein [Pseudarthrobacter defluvii]WJH25516.1 hypothetical protein JCQ34_05410 [Pseudarthrobacter defluvii]